VASAVIRARARGRFFNLVDLVNQLEQEKPAGRSGRLSEKLLRYDLIVIDELGYLPFSQPGGQLLFHLISKLYENTSLLITTTLAFADWPQGCIFLVITGNVRPLGPVLIVHANLQFLWHFPGKMLVLGGW
jgi:DNA replication protein DnaC